MDANLSSQAADFKKRSFANTLTGRKSAKAQRRKEVATKRTLPPQLSSEIKKSIKNKRNKVAPSKDPLKILKVRSRAALIPTVVDYLRSKYMTNERGPFTLDHILEDSGNPEVSHMDRHWLLNSALVGNPKVVVKDSMLSYRPVFELTEDKRSLYRIFQHHDERGLGGIYVDDIRESIGNADDLIRSLRNHICYITRQDTKKDVLYLYENSYVLSMDPEFSKMWRQISVEGFEEKSMDLELEKMGLKVAKPVTAPKKRTKPAAAVRQKRPQKSLNTHLPADFLKDFPKP